MKENNLLYFPLRAPKPIPQGYINSYKNKQVMTLVGKKNKENLLFIWSSCFRISREFKQDFPIELYAKQNFYGGVHLGFLIHIYKNQRLQGSPGFQIDTQIL